MLGDTEEKINKEKKMDKVEYTQLNFWESTLKNNYRRIGIGIVGIILIGLMLYYQAFLFGLGVLSFLMSFGITYYFWMAIRTVPTTLVIQTDLKDKVDRIVQIPNNRLADFEVVGDQSYFTDQNGSQILHADMVDLKNEKIVCAWSHKVSNYKLSMMAEAFEESKEIAKKNIKENAQYKYNTQEKALEYANSLLSEAITEPLDTLNKDNKELEKEILQEKLEKEDLDLDDLKEGAKE